MSETSLTYGLGPGGFVRMRMPEVRRAIYDALLARVGQAFDETPDSLSGQFVSVFADREAALWELAEAVYLSAYPATAQGTALDLAVSYAGVYRIQASNSTARAIYYGTQGTLIPVGALVESTYLPDGAAALPRFATTSDVLISQANAADLRLTVPAPVNGNVFSVTWGGVLSSVTVVGFQTAAFMALTLANALVANGASASASGAVVRIVSDTGTAASWSVNLALTQLGTAGNLLAVDEGATTAPANSLTTIVTPQAGWVSVNNPAAVVAGTSYETDEELRERYTTGVYRLGAGTVPSIKANLQTVAGVTSVTVYENTADTTDSEGRPPHSVEAVVEGGDDQAIAQELYRVKPAGIRSYGNVTRTVFDETGYANTIQFSRPVLRWIWLKAVLTTTAEEVIPGDVAARASAGMIAAGNALAVGENVYLQRIASEVFEVTSGVASLTLTAVATAVGAAAPAGGSYVATDIAIGPRERASFDASRVTVT